MRGEGWSENYLVNLYLLQKCFWFYQTVKTTLATSFVVVSVMQQVVSNRALELSCGSVIFISMCFGWIIFIYDTKFQLEELRLKSNVAGLTRA